MLRAMSSVMMLGAVLCWAGPMSAMAAERLQVEGSTTVGPIADAFAEAFKAQDRNVDITVKKSGSGDGAARLIGGGCDVATMSRFMKDAEFKTAVEKGVMPVAHAVAMDGVCIIVHPSNPISHLTTAQVRSIYTGAITNWRQLGGPDEPIVAITRDTNSGTFETFETLVMNKEKMAGNVETQASNPAIHGRVSKSKGAIGYVGVGFIDKEVKALEIDGVRPSKKTIASGVYPLARPLFMFTNGYPKLGSLIHRFVTFHLTQDGQDIVEAKGFVPVTDY